MKHEEFNFDTKRSLKNESFAVQSDRCRSDGCTRWVLYNFGIWKVDLSHRKCCVLLKASLNDATLKHIKLPQNNRQVFSLASAASMTAFLPVNRTVILENACNSFRLCFGMKIYNLKLNQEKKSALKIIQVSVGFSLFPNDFCAMDGLWFRLDLICSES